MPGDLELTILHIGQLLWRSRVRFLTPGTLMSCIPDGIPNRASVVSISAPVVTTSLTSPTSCRHWNVLECYQGSLHAGCRLHETLNWRCLLLSVYAEASKTSQAWDKCGVDSMSYHLFIMSAFGRWSYKLTKLQTQYHWDKNIYIYIYIYNLFFFFRYCLLQCISNTFYWV